MLAAGAAALNVLHTRTSELKRALTATTAELESKSSQLSDVMAELETARWVQGRGRVPVHALRVCGGTALVPGTACR